MSFAVAEHSSQLQEDRPFTTAGTDPARMVVAIRRAAGGLRRLSDQSLGDFTECLREKASAESRQSDDFLCAAFAAAWEAVRRVHGIEMYDVQLMAGLALVRGNVAEMQTGEGKTISAVAPAYARTVAGDSVHVATVNDYLADRDFRQVKPVFDLLKLRVGLLAPNSQTEEKRIAYRCDVTYGPGYEFGFDYLRDQIARLNVPIPRLGERLRADLSRQLGKSTGDVQYRRDFAMIDEVDSVLLDEAYVPLVISGGAAELAEPLEAVAYHSAHQLANQLAHSVDYRVETARRSVRLTQLGWDKSQSYWREHRAMSLLRAWHVYVEQALHARCIFRKDVDYVVANSKVQIVDANTGRVFSDRSWRDGLHQAVQAQEGLPITREQPSVAQISRQRFYRLYQQISGMTGTTQGSGREFRTIYGLQIAQIPLRRPCRRQVHPIRVFATQESKWKAIIQDVLQRHATGQPVLIGTRNIENSEVLAALLDSHRIPHVLLNGKQDCDEAEVVAKAGNVGAITVATNMAGRGTDIRLGPGRPQECGLHVIGEECHDLYRIDRQLMGRAARQGDPGSCQFFAAAGDSLFTEHSPWLCRQVVRAAGATGEVEKSFGQAIRRLQDSCAQRQFQLRNDLLRQDRSLDEMLDRMTKEVS
ncbi:MAG: preprotein translocase subunit SecA [Planctomycetota bacterium]|nr:preprotein translocase subunit SecA [Planctomycetota bacterium]